MMPLDFVRRGATKTCIYLECVFLLRVVNRLHSALGIYERGGTYLGEVIHKW